MSTPLGQTLRLAGLTANLNSNGSLITFRARKVRALVETEALPDPAAAPQTLKFGERGEVTIELLRSAVSAIPEVGEFFIDGDARRLKVMKVSRTPISYICECGTK